MKRKVKRFGRSLLSQILALVMLVSLLPLEARAAETSRTWGYGSGSTEKVDYTLDDTTGVLTISVADPDRTPVFGTNPPWCDGTTEKAIQTVIIQNGVEKIPDYSFKDCVNLTSVSIPNSVTSIGRNAFADCTSLAGISIPEGVTSIENDIFWECTSLVSVSIPETIVSIGQRAFYNCTALTGMTLPAGVTEIGSSAFSGCGSLTGISIPEGVTSISDNTFHGCTSLASVSLPEGLTVIGSYAFQGCTALTSMTIPEGVTTIGVSALAACDNMTVVFAGSTPPGTCTNMSQYVSYPKYYYPAGADATAWAAALANNGASGGSSSRTYQATNVSIATDPSPLTVDATDPKLVITSDGAAFNQSFLQFNGWDLYITVSNPFYGAGGYSLSDDYKTLTIGLQYIEGAALPADTTTLEVHISSEAFSSVPWDMSKSKTGTSTFVLTCDVETGMPLIPTDTKRGYCGPDGNEEAISWSYNETSHTLSIFGTGPMKDYDEENNINPPWYPYKDLIESVQINGVTSIGQDSFYGYPNLEFVHMDDTVTRIEAFAFYNCPSLSRLFLSKKLEYIGPLAFEKCTGLKSLDFPETLTHINNQAFLGCTALTRVSFASACRLGAYAFADCTGLSSVQLGSVNEIGAYAFRNSTSLERILIPSSVQKIEGLAFQGSGLKTLVFSESFPSNVDGSAFETLTDATFYYPYESHYELAERFGTLAPTWRAYFDGPGSSSFSYKRFQAGEPFTVTMSSPPALFSTDANDLKNNIYVEGGGYTLSSWEQGDSEYRMRFTFQPGENPPAKFTLKIDSGAFAGCLMSGVYPEELTYTKQIEATLPAEPDPPANDNKPTTSRPSSRDDDDDRDDRRDETVMAQKPEELLPPEVVPPLTEAPKPSVIQDIVKPTPGHVDWVERITPPDYALGLYEVLVEGSGGDSDEVGGSFVDCLVRDGYFTIDPNAPPGSDTSHPVETVEEVNFALAGPYGGSASGLSSASFESDDFYIVTVNEGDRRINYPALRLGDVVKTPNFNGVFVTHIPRGADFDSRKKEVCSYISTVYQAFDRDHPEVFWLSGKCRIRIISVGNASGGQEAYFFLSLADKEGFTMRSPAWTASGTVADGILRRDTAVSRILNGITGTTPAEKIRQLNKVLTEQNEYNTTADLNSIGNEPHECLSALEGRVGKNGPVCDGYSRAFKVLCDKLGIPCVLENGYAKPSAKSSGTFHMWTSVQIGGSWYGADVTWDDPLVKGVSGAKSGYENERYLLVGSGTEVRGMSFSSSHPASNQAANGGVAFDNGPTLSAVAFSAMTYQSGLTELPFDDVSDEDWFAEAVRFVYEEDLMPGAEETAFRPGSTLSRQEVWMILAALSGETPAGMAEARAWAMERGITDGTNPERVVTRQQLVAFLYRYCQWKGCGDAGGGGSGLSGFTDSASVSSYAKDAFAWAVNAGIVSGAGDGRLQPTGAANRAQTAVMLHRLCGSAAGSRLMEHSTQFSSTA